MENFKLERMVVLVVDDNEDVRKILIEHLQNFGFKFFLEAKDGSEAYRHVSEPHQRIDLILSDWEMPRTDGLNLLRAVRANRNRAETPFIMITSQQSQERIKISEAAKYHVNGYIVKPFMGEVLRDKIISVLVQHYETLKKTS